MNPQPSETAGAVWAIIFVLGIAFFALKAFLEGEKHTVPNDLFTLGYIENNTPTPTIYNTTNNTNNVHKTINTTKNNTITKLQLDCIDTLVAVGYKKTIARKMVLDYFKNNTAKSVHEFISDIMKK
jgi:hypothetical protein